METRGGFNSFLFHLCSHLAEARCWVSGEYMSFKMFGNVTNPAIPCVSSVSCHPHNPVRIWGQEAKKIVSFSLHGKKKIWRCRETRVAYLRSHSKPEAEGVETVCARAARHPWSPGVLAGSLVLETGLSPLTDLHGDTWVCTVTVPGLAMTSR